ncbi:DUF3179 domain-containing protein [Paraburkholderia fungorum]|jgi:hypothetical protein|uniref:DUF3179 domain-containing protein n=1 Tax=Paraburkholderia fungorum TaxID=134537 RepID=UPI0008474415|nr:DUF3179 domain-containing protein [Paraburkholderia fungorum]MBB4518575.1 hypothetical protein [Paraburkholderia fungorum]
MCRVAVRAWLTILLLTSSLAVAAPVKNGFDLDGALVAPEAVESGGPPKDGIPALDHPTFVSADDAGFLNDQDRVLGIARNGLAKAYPIAILNWHEVVNDRFAAEPVVVTFCPLCGTGMAFDAQANGRWLSFGVSGLLYNSDVLLYDRQSASLWSQLMEQAITGPMKGTRLTSLPVTHTTWGDWKRRYPCTLVLSPKTGYVRDYQHDPYAGYAQSERLMFEVRAHSARYHYHPKERVIGVSIGGAHKAYPFVELGRSPSVIHDTLGGRSIEVRFDTEHQTGSVFDAEGHEIPSVIAYWFAWFAFHTDTDVFVAK